MAKRPDTREQLLTAAEELFSTYGYAAVSIREIATEAEANLAAIKYHFGSKHELYLEVVSRTMERRTSAASWDAIAAPPQDPASAAGLLVKFVRTLLQQLLTDQGLNTCSRLMLQEAMCPSDAMDAMVKQFLRPHQERLEALLAAVAPDATPALLILASRALMGQVLYYVIFRPFLEHEEGPRHFQKKAVRDVADFAASGTLRSLGCSANVVATAFRQASPASSLVIPDPGPEP